jgi:hypothetical protein
VEEVEVLGCVGGGNGGAGVAPLGVLGWLSSFFFDLLLENKPIHS